MKKTIGLFLVLVFSLLSACGSGVKTAEDLKQTIQIHSFGLSKADENGLVDAQIIFTNKNKDKEIKYATFEVAPLNQLNDVVADELTDKKSIELKHEGPISPEGKAEWAVWKKVIKNKQAFSMRIESCLIEYMDGSKTSLSSQELDEILMGNYFAGETLESNYVIEPEKRTPIEGKLELLVGRDIKAGLYRLTCPRENEKQFSLIPLPTLVTLYKGYDNENKSGFFQLGFYALATEDKIAVNTFKAPLSSAVTLSLNDGEFLTIVRTDGTVGCYIECLDTPQKQ